MGLFSNLFKGKPSGSSSSQSQQRPIYEPQRRYTPEEFVILEQERSGETWHGVPLSELSKLARTTYRGRYVKVDQYNYLVFYYSSNSKKTQLYAQCKVDENGHLMRLPHGYYPGQYHDSADEFIDVANQHYIFDR